MKWALPVLASGRCGAPDIATFPPACAADLNGDDALDLFDFLGYFNAFNAGC